MSELKEKIIDIFRKGDYEVLGVKTDDGRATPFYRPPNFEGTDKSRIDQVEKGSCLNEVSVKYKDKLIKVIYSYYWAKYVSEDDSQNLIGETVYNYSYMTIRNQYFINNDNEIKLDITFYTNEIIELLDNKVKKHFEDKMKAKEDGIKENIKNLANSI